MNPEYIGSITTIEKYETPDKAGIHVVPVYVSGNQYRTMISRDAGATWFPYSALPNALAPVVSSSWPSFGYRMFQWADIGASDKALPNDSNMLSGTDPSRADYLIEV